MHDQPTSQTEPPPIEPGPRRLRVIAAIVPCVLALVALTQIVTASTTELSPWRGAGFGMFSTIDAPSHRVLRIEMETAAGERIPVDTRDLDIHDELRQALGNARGWPNERHLDALAAALTRTRLVIDDGIGRPAAVYAPPVDPALNLRPLIPGEAVHIAVYRLELDRETGVVTPQLLAERTVRP